MSIYQTREETLKEILDSVYASGVFKRYIVNPLSRIYTLIRAFANAQNTFVNDKMLRLQQSIHPHTSIHPHDVDLWKQRLGLADVNATYARHNVRIGSEDIPASSVVIPQGLIVKTGDGVLFRTLNSALLPVGITADARGFYTVNVVVEAIDPGTSGNVTQDAITEIEDAPSGIDVCYNQEVSPLYAARNDETLPETRARFLQAEKVSGLQMWTPDWYINEALEIADIFRAFYDSALVTGQAGLSKLYITGKFSAVSQSVIDNLYNDLNYNEEKTSGSGIVQVLPQARKDVVRTVTVRFTEAGYLPTQSELDGIAEQFFLLLERGDDFINYALKSAFFTLGGVHSVISLPDEDVVVGDDELALMGSGFAVSGEVYA